MGDLRKEGAVELTQDALNLIRDLAQRRGQGLALEGMDFGQAYIQGDLKLALDFSVGPGLKNYYAVFGKHPLIPTAKADLGGTADDEVVDVEIGVRHAQRLQVPMLLRIVEGVEAANQVVPSVVWLDRLSDEVRKFRTDTLYFSLTQLTTKSIQIPAHRQGLAMGLDLGGSAKRLNHSDNSVVERRSEIVGDVSYSEGPLLWERNEEFHLVKVISGLRVFIDDRAVRLECEELTNGLVKVTDLALGPF